MIWLFLRWLPCCIAAWRQHVGSRCSSCFNCMCLSNTFVCWSLFWKSKVSHDFRTNVFQHGFTHSIYVLKGKGKKTWRKVPFGVELVRLFFADNLFNRFGYFFFQLWTIRTQSAIFTTLCIIHNYLMNSMLKKRPHGVFANEMHCLTSHLHSMEVLLRMMWIGRRSFRVHKISTCIHNYLAAVLWDS